MIALKQMHVFFSAPRALKKLTSMATPTKSPPHLYKRIARKALIHRAMDVIIILLLISIVAYRLLTLKSHGFAWLVALLCESWFTFYWLLTVSTKWNQLDYHTYPKRLSQWEEILPRVDMFVTTAHPVLEPPIITINTVLSLLAVVYPTDKLACYVSDDACSPLTYYSLVEASKFAKLWVPFCKKYNVQVRAPFRFFSDQNMLCEDQSLEFKQDFKKMKDEYAELGRKIKDAVQTYNSWDLVGDLAVFSNIEPRNHPTIIKVILDNKQDHSSGSPILIYISREKRLNIPHHYKAGAMNVLTRVSGLITNAPFMLNVDCDMFANNPLVVRHAMCLLLGSKNERDCAFVQFPQHFYDGLKDDPFGNQFVVWQEYVHRGWLGLQGTFYGGSGCFHRRKVIYGLCPDDIGDEAINLSPVSGCPSDEEMLNIYGNSKEFVESISLALQGKTLSREQRDTSDLLKATYKVAGCRYEYGTCWGQEIGLLYGSATEDVLTGLLIHARGWRSKLCTPQPSAFLGCAPSGGPAALTQHKRWVTGLQEILFTTKSPVLLFFTTKLQFRQCLAYLSLNVWGLRSVPELCYAFLPAYCVISNSSFLPKVKEPAFFLYAALFMTYHYYTLTEYLQIGLSIRAWWNNQVMAKITSVTAKFLGLLSVILKLLGLSETVFEVTQKDDSTSGENNDDDASRFTFDESPVFLPGTTLFLVQLIALIMSLINWLKMEINDENGSGFGEIASSVMVVIFFWPFLKGLFGRGKYGIPLYTLCKSTILGLLFVNFSAAGLQWMQIREFREEL